jgi:hypothetical protein
MNALPLPFEISWHDVGVFLLGANFGMALAQLILFLAIRKLKLK